MANAWFNVRAARWNDLGEGDYYEKLSKIFYLISRAQDQQEAVNDWFTAGVFNIEDGIIPPTTRKRSHDEAVPAEQQQQQEQQQQPAIRARRGVSRGKMWGSIMCEGMGGGKQSKQAATTIQVLRNGHLMQNAAISSSQQDADDTPEWSVDELPQGHADSVDDWDSLSDDGPRNGNDQLGATVDMIQEPLAKENETNVSVEEGPGQQAFPGEEYQNEVEVEAQPAFQIP